MLWHLNCKLNLWDMQFVCDFCWHFIMMCRGGKFLHHVWATDRSSLMWMNSHLFRPLLFSPASHVFDDMKIKYKLIGQWNFIHTVTHISHDAPCLLPIVGYLPWPTFHAWLNNVVCIFSSFSWIPQQLWISLIFVVFFCFLFHHNFNDYPQYLFMKK